METMGSCSVLLSTLAILLLSLSHATCQSPIQPFLNCLSNNSVTDVVYTRDNSSFMSILNFHIHNNRLKTPSTPKPLAIVTAKNESHVQATVTCAKSNGVQLRIRSGGHDYEGLSYVSDVPFVILDLFPLSAIDLDIQNGFVWVQSGATLGQLYYKVHEKSPVQAIPAGVCITVGAGGYFGGGGYGNLMRKYGLSVDNIIDAQIVDVNGRILDRRTMGEDLFWAIRGGGAASFGVVIAWKIKLVPVPPLVTVFKVNKTVEQGATDVVYRWQEVAPHLDEDLYVRVESEGVAQGGKKTVRVSFIGQFLGLSDRLLGLMNSSFPELGLQKSDCIEMPWINSTLYWANFTMGTPLSKLQETPIVPNPILFFKSRSDYVKTPIPKEALNGLWNKLIEAENMVMQFNPYGGMMAQISPSATPFPHRAGNLFKIQYYMSWEEDGEDATNRYMNLSKMVHEFMTPYVSNSPRESFLNYRDLDIGANPSNVTNIEVARTTYGIKYFKENFERLVSVKTRVDPQNFFRNEQSIPPRS